MRFGGGSARVLGVFVAVVALLSFGPPTATAGTPPAQVTRLSDADADVEVFMDVGATAQQVGAVERRIRASGDVRRFAHLTKDDAYGEFQRIFRNKPDLVAPVTADDLPESFRVQLRSGVSRNGWARDYSGLDGVDAVAGSPDVPTENDALQLIRNCQATPDVDVEIFLRVGATAAQLAAAVAAARAEPGMTVTRVLTQRDAYEEFERIFAKKPKLVRSITAADLPMSIRIQVAEPVPSDAIARLRALAGVDDVANPGAVCAGVNAGLARGYTPEQLAHLFARYVKTGELG